MKTTSKLVSGISLSVFASSLLITMPAFAMSGQNDSSSTNTQSDSQTESQQSVFCKGFDTVEGKTSVEITKKSGDSGNQWQQSRTDVTKSRADWAAKLATARNETAKKRAENFTKLEATATTDAEKAAVKVYEGKVTNAVAVRQAAYDANFDAYFKAVDTLLASQKTNSSGDVDSFKAAVAAAINKAKASCTAGTSADQIKTQLRTDLKAARDNFKGTKTTDKSSIKSQLTALKKARIDANTTARSTFKSVIEAARTELKAAFPSTTSSTI